MINSEYIFKYQSNINGISLRICCSLYLPISLKRDRLASFSSFLTSFKIFFSSVVRMESSFFLIAFHLFWILAFSCNREIRNSSDGLVCFFGFLSSWFNTGNGINHKPEIQLPLDPLENQGTETMSIL